jgi:phosphocarrier protein
VRTCGKFVRVAGRFRAEIFVKHGDVEVNGKSILGVMMLAAERGAEILLRTEGDDEIEALAALVRVVNDKFGEE